MPKTVSLQSSFNAGVLDPRLASRTDIEKYYSGLSVGTNILCTPQGGFKRRPGMAFVDDIGADGHLASFAFNVEQTYLLIFTNNNIEIFKDGVSQANVTTTYTLAEIPDVRYTQSADTMIIVHEDHAPATLVRGASHASWTLSDITFSNVPQYDFNDGSSPAQVDEVQKITIPSTTWVGGETFKLDLDGQITTAITWAVASTAINEERIQTALRALSNTSTTGIAVAYVPASSPEEYTVTFDGTDGGIDWVQIVGREDTTPGVTITTTANGAPGTENIWSAIRGYPRSVTFHQGRLIFGGTKERIQTVMASVTNDFYNFDTGTGLDDQAIVATMDTDQVNAISAIISARHLLIFTSGGEFIEKSIPLTPGGVAITRQTQYGSIGLPPVNIDGASMFVERRGKVVREFIFAFSEDAYNAAPVSILAPHLINSPVDMTARKGTATDDANLVFIVNSDGTVAVLNTLRSEGVAGWTKWETAGEILSIVAVVDEVYILVKRTINAVVKYYLEKLDEDTYTDSNISQTQASSTTVTGLGNLDGESCRVKADGAVMIDATPSGGSITLARAGVDVEVGLNFNVTATTMPLNVNFASGPTLMKEKRIIHAQVDLYQSLGVIIQGKRLPDRTMSGPLPDIPEPYTGMKEVWLTGWNHIADLTITQIDPLPMFVRGLSLKLEVS